MSRIYYRGAGAAIVCFDLTNPESWNKVKFWVQELSRHEPECKIFIVGTKRDLISSDNDTAIPRFEIDAYRKSISAIGFFQTSAKSDMGVNELFSAVAGTYVHRVEDHLPQQFRPIAVKQASQSKLLCCS
eukprot:c4829_g1_i3.p1 GENE.c4829_g1_i3~~c4829_g1_i3.p1  ORF type:complete len:130 (+),score=13.12 c4829_g1_i3:428-817(+)